MSRHLMHRQKDKVDVGKALSFPKNAKERRLQLDYIRNKGNFEYNCDVMEKQKGELIPSQQPKKKVEGHEYLHCLHCYGLFRRTLMWRHFKRCKLKPLEKSKRSKQRVQALCAFAEPAPAGISDCYWKFLSGMNQDKISLAVKEDQLILEFGYRLFNKNQRVTSQHPHIRQKLRELGRLVIEAKEIHPVKTIKDLIKPERYNVINVSATKRLAGLNEETGRYLRPTLARKVGFSMHSLALFLKSEALKKRPKKL